jgi:hypothetical protein
LFGEPGGQFRIVKAPSNNAAAFAAPTAYFRPGGCDDPDVVGLVVVGFMTF